MDCSEFRQMILGDPSTAEGEAHVDACADCRAYLEEISALDATLVRAMSIDVPELKMPALPQLDTDKVVTLAERRRLTTPVWLATAAAITLAVFLGVRNYTADTGFDSLADEIVAHMDHEPYALRVTDERVSDNRLARVVPASLANLTPETGLITYAQSCEINGHSVPHLVVQGEAGPVTILLLPDESIDEAIPLSGDWVNGVLIPVGSGSIAIIGNENEEDFERIQQNFVDSVSWRT